MYNSMAQSIHRVVQPSPQSVFLPEGESLHPVVFISLYPLQLFPTSLQTTSLLFISMRLYILDVSH